MKKVKILKHMPNYEPGQIVEVEDNVAKELCSIGHINFGDVLYPNQRAILLEDFQAQQAAPVDMENLSQAELKALNMKNVVAAPKPAPAAPVSLAEAKEEMKEEEVEEKHFKGKRK